MAHGSATGRAYHPREQTQHWAAAATVGCAALALLLHDWAYLFAGGMFFALLLQCGQRIEVDRGSARRIGLRPVVLDLYTAEVVRAGSSWWRELFFCATPLLLRDADGNRLYLESWLWDAKTRHELLELSRERCGS
jgi:hypothetical protein